MKGPHKDKVLGHDALILKECLVFSLCLMLKGYMEEVTMTFVMFQHLDMVKL